MVALMVEMWVQKGGTSVDKMADSMVALMVERMVVNSAVRMVYLSGHRTA